jgi:predicted NodU family carbamoyl transferase
VVDPDMVYVTHWAPTGKLSDMGHKYWHPEVFDGVPIRTLTPDRTHHDTHINAAIAYAGPYFTTRPGCYGLVIDGFGTMGEHLSLYRFTKGAPILIKRVRGYETSLGLWYQYATAFMGMKMHEDEYKLLGYEVHCPMAIVDDLISEADGHAADILDKMEESVYGSVYDPIFNLDALPAIKNKIFEHLTEVCQKFNIADPTSHTGRAILARYVQRVLESVVTSFVRYHAPEMKHLLCGGGVFLNVKLNKRLIDMVKGQLCVFPLAGDQGNALGLYAMDHPLFGLHGENGTLKWGKRQLRNVGTVDGIYWLPEDEAKEYALHLLKTVGYVNVVRGGMEFGPRALCNTSTLAIATEDNVSRINQANNRNTVMPMAPVMTPGQYFLLFKDTDKVWRSEEHMIVAMEYRDRPSQVLRGVAHCYTFLHQDPVYTGRPQVVDVRDTFMMDILTEIGHPLINTSFNFHGKPIAYDSESVIENHILQYQRDPSFKTIIIPN